MTQRLTFMPKTRLEVAPWFASLPPGFSDATSYRHMIDFVEAEVVEVGHLLDDMILLGLTKEIAEAQDDLDEAATLLAELNAALAAILLRKET